MLCLWCIIASTWCWVLHRHRRHMNQTCHAHRWCSTSSTLYTLPMSHTPLLFHIIPTTNVTYTAGFLYQTHYQFHINHKCSTLPSSYATSSHTELVCHITYITYTTNATNSAGVPHHPYHTHHRRHIHHWCTTSPTQPMLHAQKFIAIITVSVTNIIFQAHKSSTNYRLETYNGYIEA